MQTLKNMLHGEMLFWVIILCTLLSGCLLVRTTEHRVKLNDDGSGEAALRLIDIRSDGTTDSAVVHDFDVMMSSFETEGIRDFEERGRRVTDKKMYVRGDTLFAEVVYSFSGLTGVEGLFVTSKELYLSVGPEREILRTNGKIRPGPGNTLQVVWDRDAKRLMYQIREREIPPSVSLASHYLKHKK